eukprot:TRINITY_DN8785_c0_g1_i1.p1 TRINITY_DN8785_c0_g1~~TRINITY_DN8785_c0_g1_i1.p1  ORF type:complete len:317 (-),score=19.36 TRINITY_DN8785_c0_g1_i1:42-938(-)
MTVVTTAKDHKRSINSMDFSNDGEILVTAGDDEAIHVYSALDGKHKNKLYSKKYGVDLIRFTRGNQSNVLYASKNGWNDSMRYLSLEDNCFIRYFTGHKGQVLSMSVSPQDDLFLSSSLDETVRVWDTRVASCQGVIHKTGRVVTTFDPQGILFAVGSDENAISLYDIKSYDRAPFLLFKFNRTPFQWKSLEFSYNGRSILGLTDDNTIFLIDAFNGNVQLELKIEEGLQVLSASFTPDSQFILAGLSDNSVRVWSSHSGVTVTNLSSSSTPSVLKWNPKRLMFATCGKELAFWAPKV